MHAIPDVYKRQVQDRGIAMMLADDVNDRLRNALLLSHHAAVTGVRRQNGGGNARIGAVMGIVAHLVFLEVERALELAHVVVVGAYAGQHAVGADCVGGGLGQVGHYYRVVIGCLLDTSRGV